MTGEKSDEGVGEGQREEEGERESNDVIDGEDRSCWTIVSDIVVSRGIRGEKPKAWNSLDLHYGLMLYR